MGEKYEREGKEIGRKGKKKEEETVCFKGANADINLPLCQLNFISINVFAPINKSL